MSILYHVSNRHTFKGDHFKKCEHKKMTRKEKKAVKWLKCDSPAYQSLDAVINDRYLLKDLQGLSQFCHTGDLEVFHSMLLKYCPKRQHFKFDGMVARHTLAVLDHNHNVGRQQAITQEGDKRFNVVYSKAQKNWVHKSILVKKNYDYIDQLMLNTLDRQVSKVEVVSTEGKAKPKNIAPVDKMSKNLIELLHKSKFPDKAKAFKK